MAGLSDRQRNRTPSGALLEMSALANEKQRLNQELAAAQRRHAEIESRLAEIAAKERRLQQYVKDPALVASLQACPESAASAPRRIRAKEINY